SALLSAEQVDDLRTSMGLNLDTEWDRFDPETPEGRLCADVAALLDTREPKGVSISAPRAIDVPVGKRASTQETLGRALSRLHSVQGVGDRVVTVSPDVAMSTGLGAWVNKVGAHGYEQADRANENALEN